MTKYYLVKSTKPNEFFVNTPMYLERVDNKWNPKISYKHAISDFPPDSEDKKSALNKEYRGLPSTTYSDFLFTKPQIHEFLDMVIYPKRVIQNIKPISPVRKWVSEKLLSYPA